MNPTSLKNDRKQYTEKPPKPQFDFDVIPEALELKQGIKAEAEALGDNGKTGNNVLPFPTDAFPGKLQEIIRETNQHLNYPTDFIGASILFAVSVAIGNTHRLEMKKAWQENAVLYIAIVGKAGTNKSHPLHFAINPIIEHDQETYNQYKIDKKEYSQALNQTKKEKEKPGYEEPIKPIWKKFLLSDYTPEALVQVHKFNMRGIGIYADELAGWFKNFNRYHKGSEQESWTANWSGKPITIDRKTDDPIQISKPFISVAGTIQDAVLYQLAKDNRTENGFTDRILFAFPDNLKKSYWSDTDISEKVIEDYNQIILKILELPLTTDSNGNPDPVALKFTGEARNRLRLWQRNNTDLSNQIENEPLAGIYSKLEIYVIRLALVLQFMRWACNEAGKDRVDLQAVEAAIKLTEYFRKTAEKVYSLLDNNDPLAKLSSEQRNLYEKLPEKFTTGIGIKIAENMKIPKRTFNRFLKEKSLFERVGQGKYEKRIREKT